MTDLKCSHYTLDSDVSTDLPCHCPKCGAFLHDFPLDKPFTCKKCKTELITLPDHDEETHEELESGRICPIKLRAKPNE